MIYAAAKTRGMKRAEREAALSLRLKEFPTLPASERAPYERAMQATKERKRVEGIIANMPGEPVAPAATPWGLGSVAADGCAWPLELPLVTAKYRELSHAAQLRESEQTGRECSGKWDLSLKHAKSSFSQL
eukprot:3611385-Alexandrium_andersonii.AAC.1